MTALRVAEAQAAILQQLHRQPSLRLPLADAIGHRLADDVVAAWPLPMWTAASMDGYAVHGDDVRGASEHTLVRRGIGRKFQTPAIFASLSVAQNIEAALGFREPLIGLLRPLRSSAHDQLVHVLDTVGLVSKSTQPAGTLSHVHTP